MDQEIENFMWTIGIFNLHKILSYKSLIFAPIFLAAVITEIAVPKNATWAADPIFERGQKLFKKCIHCHTYQKGQNHRIGPNLSGMFGRKAGAASDFEFSDAWKNANFVWTEATLDNYLKSPGQMIPGNRMPFDGFSRPTDRHALITYMKMIVSEEN